MEGLRVSVDEVTFLPNMETPEDRPYAFAYFITIHNGADQSVEIRGRKWVVKSVNGQALVVEGDGVVGKFPRIGPGESFSYNSYHVVGSESFAEGAFLGIRQDGIAVLTRIPRFQMIPPSPPGS